MWPIIVCPGRTARPSTCQSRTSASHTAGSVIPKMFKQLGEDRDTIVGLVYAKDDLRRLHTNGDEEGPWDDLLRAPTLIC